MEPPFVAFLQPSQKYVYGLSYHSFKFCLKNSEFKTAYDRLLGLLRALFLTTFLEIAVGGNESQPGQKILEKLAKPLSSIVKLSHEVTRNVERS